MPYGGRSLLLAAVAAFLLSGILLRCYWLQCVEGSNYAQISESNAIQQRVLRPARGVIVDRRGVPLAINRPSFDVTFLPKGVPREEYERIAGELAELMGTEAQPPTRAELFALMKEARRRPFNSMLLAADVSRRIVAAISERKSDLPGVLIENRARRYYPLGPATAHLLGYIGEASPEEIESSSGYIRGDLVGRAGVEAALEPRLAGVKGYENVEVDALGQTVRKLSEQPAVAGARVTLTVDADIQRWAREAFGRDSSGAVVALEPKTGRILALYSAPAYDPNVFADRKRSAERMSLFSDTMLPMLNRALQSTYSPGSTFKTVTMLAGLLTGKLTPSTVFHCAGVYAGMHCWKEGGHGSLDLVSAYQHSCNIYFYQAGERIWIEPLHMVAEALGLDQFPGFGLGPEEHGVVPTPEWEKAHVKGPDADIFGTGDVRNTAIGQGYVLVSPAQMARLVSSAVTAGVRMKPAFVESIEDADGSVSERFEPHVEADLKIPDEIMGTLRTAMKAVVEDGTGYRAKIEGLSIGGKTGTAQSPTGLDHAWFICAAPLEDPKIGLCIMLENAAQHGGTVAAPIAKYIVERYARREGWISDTAVAPPPRRTRPPKPEVPGAPVAAETAPAAETRGGNQ